MDEGAEVEFEVTPRPQGLAGRTGGPTLADRQQTQLESGAGPEALGARNFFGARPGVPPRSLAVQLSFVGPCIGKIQAFVYNSPMTKPHGKE